MGGGGRFGAASSSLPLLPPPARAAPAGVIMVIKSEGLVAFPLKWCPVVICEG